MSDPHHVVDFVEKVAHNAGPFMLGMAQAQPKLSGTRVIEAVIIAAVVGALSMAYNTLHVIPQIQLEQKYERQNIEKDIAYIRAALTELKQELHGVKNQVEFVKDQRR